jgi:drug/metabolite transporter (DMT)-like permease
MVLSVVENLFATVTSYWGELFGLGAALLWAITSLIFVKMRAPAAAINLFKNGWSCVFVLVTIVVLGARRGSLLQESGILSADLTTWGWLTASAITGLVIGDTAYFRSLQILGPRRCLTLTTVSPLISALLALLFLDENLGLVAWSGMAVTLAGVLWVIRERTPPGETPGHYPGSTLSGVLAGTIAALGTAFGAVCSKQAMNRGVDALDATFGRMCLAVVIGAAIAASRAQLVGWIKTLCTRASLARIVPAAFMGSFLGVWFCLLAYKHTKVGIATTMHSTSPIFILPLVLLVSRQRVTLRAALGALVAVAGIAMLFLEA